MELHDPLNPLSGAVVPLPEVAAAEVMAEETQQESQAQPEGEAELLKRRHAAAHALAELIYDRTADNKTAGSKWLRRQQIEELNQEDLEQLLCTIGGEQAAEELKNIKAIEGKKDTYYYDASIMTRHFAQLDALIEDKDILNTIATVTRSDCKLYPRPAEFAKFMDYPFHFSRDEVLGAAARFKEEADYADIGVVEASNGEKAFFSSQSMKQAYARALLEGSEVESKKWP